MADRKTIYLPDRVAEYLADSDVLSSRIAGIVLRYQQIAQPILPPGSAVKKPPKTGKNPLKAIDTLPALQKAIVQADLAADGTADAQRLAEIHGTSKNSIYVSRNKAHENLKKRVDELMRQPAGKR